MKKFLAFVLAVTAAFGLMGCGGKITDKEAVKVFLPDGTPILAMAELMTENPKMDNLNTKYEIIDGSIIMSKLMTGAAEIAILPTNLAVKAYNSGLEYKLLSTNIHGVMYLVGKGEKVDLEGLKGKVVYNIGQGATPDLMFKYILKGNNIQYEEGKNVIDANKVYLQYVSGASELIPLLKSGKASYGIFGEPVVAQANDKGETTTMIDMQAEWKKLTQDSKFPQASLVVKTSFAQKHPEYIKELMVKVKSNLEWVVDGANTEQMGKAFTRCGSLLTVNFTLDTIGRCNLDVIEGIEAKPSIDKYLNSILEVGMGEFFGGKLPSAEFYYSV